MDFLALQKKCGTRQTDTSMSLTNDERATLVKLELKKAHETFEEIGILTAANPGNYPLVAPLVHRSGGTFIRVKEAELPQYGKEMKASRGTLMGPASMVCYAGFFQAVDKGLIKSGDVVLLNTGEGSDRAQWFKDLVEEN